MKQNIYYYKNIIKINNKNTILNKSIIKSINFIRIKDYNIIYTNVTVIQILVIG